VGNVSAFVGFWLIVNGKFGSSGIPLLIGVIFLANFMGDMLWYFSGKKLRNTRLGEWIRARVPNHEKVEAHMQDGWRIIMVSKFVYSAAPAIFLSGWSGMEFKKFIRTSLASIALWAPILFGTAYGLITGLLPLQTLTLFRRFEILFIVGVVLFFVVNFLLSRLLRRILHED